MKKLCLEWVHWNTTPYSAGFISFFPFIFNFEKWQATPGSVSWFERRKKQSEIRILKEQLAGKRDLGNGTTACCLPLPLLYYSPSAKSREWGREVGTRDRRCLCSSLAYIPRLVWTPHLSFGITFGEVPLRRIMIMGFWLFHSLLFFKVNWHTSRIFWST